MANKRISDLPVVTTSTVGDVLPIDGTTTRKITVENLLQPNLVALKGLTSAANKGIQFTGVGTVATYDLTAAGKALLDDADAAAQRTTLGLGNVDNTSDAAKNSATVTLTNKTISGVSNTLTVREADLSTTDVTTANVSTTKHGFAPKLPNDATKYLDGTGNYTVPAGGGGSSSPSLFPGYLSGLTLWNNATDATNDIDVAAGTANDSSDTDRITLSAAITKRADAVWAAGTGNGGRFHTTLANGTLHYYLIKNPTTNVVDVGCSDQPTNPVGDANYPAGFTLYRRIGSIPRESGSLIQFVQDGDTFQRSLLAPSTIVNPGTSAVLVTLPIPTGIRVAVLLSTSIAILAPNTSDYSCIFTDPSMPDVAPTVSLCDLLFSTISGQLTRMAVPVVVMSNTSAQIRYRHSQSNASLVFNILIKAWSDARGKK